MKCTKCESENINIQVITNTKSIKDGHGFLWWLIIGWWWHLLLWIVLFLPKLLVTIFGRKKTKIITTTTKMAICQNCGYSWEIKE